MDAEEYEPGAMPHAEADETAEETVIIPAAGTESETAQALLDAAESSGHDAGAVRHSDGAFHVPNEVADAADLPEGGTSYQRTVGEEQQGPDDDTSDDDTADDEPSTPPRKRAAAKRAPSKRAAAKR